MATIKQIAKLAGVSRGTVDRVLNNRGSVNPQTAIKVKEIAEAFNYSPNRPAQTLAIKKKNLVFGYILFGSTSSNQFFEEVVASINKKAVELEEYGVKIKIRYSPLDNPYKQSELIDELIEAGASGIALTPINHPVIIDKINDLYEKGIPVVTANSDLPGCKRIAYVGSDYYKSGATAEGLMSLMTQGRAKVGIVIGSPLVLCHSQRVEGFKRNAEKYHPEITIVGEAVNNDDDLESFDVTGKLLRKHPEINALFLAAAGIKGACRAVENMNLAGKIKIVCYDLVSSTIDLLERGVITAVISQQPEVQGKKPLDLLLDYLGMGRRPAKSEYFTKIDIAIRENI